MKNYISGKYIQKKGYKSFLPNSINDEFVFSDNNIFSLLEKANRYLGELNRYSMLVPDVNAFVKMYTVKESTASNSIEGTKTKVSDAVLPLKEIDLEKKDDWKEVHNYLKAINFAIKKLDKMPVSLRLIKDTHKILLSGVRGSYKLPGEIRKSQNWIGGTNPGNAHFVPPHFDDLPELLSDWEKFWHNKKLNVPVLVKIAICHYQFETIHPFLDGNGRIGRLIMVLQLIEKNILKFPVLYLSTFLNANRQSYFFALESVRTKNELDGWVSFILEGIITSAKNSIKILDKIIILRKNFEDQIVVLERRQKIAKEIIMCFFSQPAWEPKNIAKKLNIAFNTANSLLLKLEDLGILVEVTRTPRNRLFVMKKYVDLFND